MYQGKEYEIKEWDYGVGIVDTKYNRVDYRIEKCIVSDKIFYLETIMYDLPYDTVYFSIIDDMLKELSKNRFDSIINIGKEYSLIELTRSY